VLQKIEATSHTYNSATARNWNNAVTEGQLFLGNAQAVQFGIFVSATSGANGAPATYAVWDWTAGGGANADPLGYFNTAAVFAAIAGSNSVKSLAAGYHYLRAVEVEFAAVVSTFARVTISATPNV